MSQVIPEAIFESSFKHRVEMARTKVDETKDVVLFVVVDGIEKGTVALLGYAIVTEETTSDTDSDAIFTRGKSIYEYFDDAKLHDVLAKYEKLAKVASHPTETTIMRANGEDQRFDDGLNRYENTTESKKILAANQSHKFELGGLV